MGEQEPKVGGLRRMRRAGMTGVLLALVALVALTGAWWDHQSVDQPLSADEFKAVVDEIDAMVRTPGERVDEFVVRAATPARIARLFRSEALARLDKQQRQNALILAERGDLLRFNAPADIVRAMDRWFPREMVEARSGHRLRALPLHGPFPGWDDEPAAFVTLWHCMPEKIWRLPGESPFEPDARDPAYRSLAMESARDFDFGACVKEQEGPAKWLASAFSRHLQQRGCQDTGPDDCVLVAWLWSSLEPADPALAPALQALAPQVLARPPVPDPDSESGRRERLVRDLRQGAFLGAQLASLAAAPSAWPDQTLAQALQQLEVVQNDEYRARSDPERGWGRYAAYDISAIDPAPRVAAAALQSSPASRAQIKQVLQPILTHCERRQSWMHQMPPAVLGELALGAWQAGRPYCLPPDENWLRADPGPQARQLRASLVKLLQDAPGRVHEEVLDVLTDDGGLCFKDGPGQGPEEVQQICRQWISEPASTDDALPHTGHRVQPADRFAALASSPVPKSLLGPRPATLARREAWLEARLASLGAADGHIRRLFADLRQDDLQVIELRRWGRADGQQQVVELDLAAMHPEAPPLCAIGAPVPRYGDRLLLLIGAGQVQEIDEPARLDRSLDQVRISQVTDVDHDGRPEIWRQGVSRDCGDEDEHMKPGEDCARPETRLGEVWGDTLSYFAWTPSATRSEKP